jgi:hypothetical protein
LQHQKEIKIVLTLIIKRTMKQIKNEMFGLLSRKEMKSVLGGSMTTPEKEHEEQNFFEQHGIYQI